MLKKIQGGGLVPMNPPPADTALEGTIPAYNV